MKLKVIFSFIICASCVLTSCQKPVKGCMNEHAENFNVNADEDDGSCTFAAKVKVWQYKFNSETLVAGGSKTLNVYFDNALVGSFQASQFLNNPPGCSGTGLLDLVYDLGKESTKNVIVKVSDETNKTVFSRSVSFYADHTCVSIAIE